MNIQPIEKRELRPDGHVVVHSIFKTIQGEGPFCGTACVFIRLAGCNLQCPACDTDYTSTRELMSPDTIVNEVAKRAWGGLVVVTGGEPFRQDIEPLLRRLLQRNYYVQIETNGTMPPAVMAYSHDTTQRRGVYVVCSPKSDRVQPAILEAACALKYVVQAGDVDPADGLPIHALERHVRSTVAKPPRWWGSRPVYVQPMDAKDEALNQANINTAVAACLMFGHTLQLQIHKYIGVE